MQPLKFKECNTVFAANQPEYLPLPAYKNPDDESGNVITCWELTESEIEYIVKNKHIFLSQLTFNSALQPIRPFVPIEQSVVHETYYTKEQLEKAVKFGMSYQKAIDYQKAGTYLISDDPDVESILNDLANTDKIGFEEIKKDLYAEIAKS